MTWATGGFELASTIILVLEATRLTKCASHPKIDENKGELIGFIELGFSTINYATFKKQDKLQSQVIAFFIRELTTNLKISFSYFATKGITTF